MEQATVTAKEIIKREYRPIGSTMAAVRECCAGKIDMIEDEWRLERDVFERLRKLNSFVKERTPEITAVLTAEVLREFFESSDVSYATEGIREDLKRNTTLMDDNVTTCINHFLRPASEEEDGSYVQFREWITALCGDTATETNYFAKFHHCGWHDDTDCERTINCMNLCESVSLTSFILQLIRRTCPSGVVCLQSPGLSSLSNVDRTLDHILFIAEEAPIYLVPKPTTITTKDTTNIFTERLIKGIQSTVCFFVREEDNRRDMKCVKTSSRGSCLMAATGLDGDRNLLSRFMFINVNSDGPDIKELTDFQLSQHRDLHRLYFIIEMMIKCGVAKVDSNDVETMIRDTQCETGTDKLFQNRRSSKRIMGMARTICIASTIWRVMMSPEFNHLQYDSRDPTKYLGINVRLFTEGIFPLLVIDTKMVFNACTLCSL